MTNQEAISVLESINAKTDYFLINDDARTEALDMAIFALRVPDGPDINVGSMISRQTAIDAFYKHPNINWTTLDVLTKINALPSAEPEIVICKNCKNIWYSGTATIKGVPTKIYKCNWWDNRVVSEKGFCFMAERKTDE